MMDNKAEYIQQAQYAEHVRRLADISFEMEKARGETLDKLSVHLLTCITILSVALITPASSLFSYYGASEATVLTGAQVRLTWMYLVVFALLITALLLVLFSQVLRKMTVLGTPGDIFKNYYANNSIPNDTLQIYIGCTERYCQALDAHVKGLTKKHEKQWKLLRVSLILMAIAVILSFVFGMYLAMEAI